MSVDYLMSEWAPTARRYVTWRIFQLAFQLLVCDKGARYPPRGESSRVKDLPQIDLYNIDKGSKVYDV